MPGFFNPFSDALPPARWAGHQDKNGESEDKLALPEEIGGKSQS